MTFVVTLMALVVERFFDWSHVRGWHWYARYQQAVVKKLPNYSPYIILALTIVPLLALASVAQFLLQDALFGLGELVFQAALFLYCLGPQNFWADTFASMNALVHDDQQLASQKLKTSFGISEGSSSQLHAQLIHHMLIAANRRVFAIVFWFLILGPVGAVLYRTVTLSSADYAKQETAPELIQSAQFIESILDFIPVRILTFVFALGGHFVNVFTCWRKHAALGLVANETLLTQCGAAALGNDFNDKNIEDTANTTEKSIVGLIDRSFIITLVIVAIIVMLG